MGNGPFIVDLPMEKKCDFPIFSMAMLDCQGVALDEPGVGATVEPGESAA